MSGGVLVRLDRVTKRFGGNAPAIDAISATVAAGGITGLVGPDGAGKTTLIRRMTGIMMTEEGTVQVIGASPDTATDALCAALGYMPHRCVCNKDLIGLDPLGIGKTELRRTEVSEGRQ